MNKRIINLEYPFRDPIWIFFRGIDLMWDRVEVTVVTDTEKIAYYSDECLKKLQRPDKILWRADRISIPVNSKKKASLIFKSSSCCLDQIVINNQLY